MEDFGENSSRVDFDQIKAVFKSKKSKCVTPAGNIDASMDFSG